MERRAFLQTLAGAAAATLAPAAQPLPIKLGFDTYSVRAFRWKAPQLLDYAASLGLDTIQISDLGEYESLDPAYLSGIKDRAARLGVAIDAGMGFICPSSKSFHEDGPPAREYLLSGLRTAKAVGAASMRCIMGNGADRLGPLPIEAHMENTIKVFRSVRSEALDLRVTIALENHGDLQARELKTILDQSGRDFTAACLDTGNPISAIEDPLLTLETLAPYVVTTHMRDTAIFEHPRGAAWQWVALGEGSVDFPRFMERFRALCPKSSMQLEIITGRPPTVLPYHEPEFWNAYRSTPAWEFERFLALVRSGRPFMGRMVIEDGSGAKPPAFDEALKQQQRTDLERSLDYARAKLGAGVRPAVRP